MFFWLFIFVFAFLLWLIIATKNCFLFQTESHRNGEFLPLRQAAGSSQSIRVGPRSPCLLLCRGYFPKACLELFSLRTHPIHTSGWEGTQHGAEIHFPRWPTQHCLQWDPVWPRTGRHYPNATPDCWPAGGACPWQADPFPLRLALRYPFVPWADFLN